MNKNNYDEWININDLSNEEFDHYTKDYFDYLFFAQEGLLRFGGTFANNLGNLLASADVINKMKIINIFRHELEEHAKLFILWAKKHRPNLLRIKENNDNDLT